MFDELDRLRESVQLANLLAHYAHLGHEDRENWQDRLMQMEGVTSTELSKLHGELIAFGWIEQNTGQVAILKPEAVSSCYRITLAGQKAIQQATGSMSDDAEPTVLKLPERTRPKLARKKAKERRCA